jgi:hypothetical protein
MWRGVFLLAALALMNLQVPTLRADDAVQQPESLQEKTREAQKRLAQWDEEERRYEQREAWEAPLAAALFLAGAALAAHDKTYAYAASFSGAAGLTVHFWTSRPGPRPAAPSTPAPPVDVPPR